MLPKSQGKQASIGGEPVTGEKREAMGRAPMPLSRLSSIHQSCSFVGLRRWTNSSLYLWFRLSDHRRCVGSWTTPNPTKAGTSASVGFNVGYITDIEGNLSFWHRYVTMSKVLRRNERGEIELKDGDHFVFGGDLWDRGPGDMRVLRDLLSLKQRYPERVHFILGNRDLNKVRLLAEMSAVARAYSPRLYIYPQVSRVEK